MKKFLNLQIEKGLKAKLQAEVFELSQKSTERFTMTQFIIGLINDYFKRKESLTPTLSSVESRSENDSQ